MGYFPNGSSQMDYEQVYCSTCAHQEGCAVMNAHFLRGYDECNNDESILHMLIPQTEDGLSNKKCLMHLPSPPTEKE